MGHRRLMGCGPWVRPPWFERDDRTALRLPPGERGGAG